MEQKKFTASIYLYLGQAVKGLRDKTVIAEHPEELAADFSNNNADEILIFDMSEGDEEHEQAISVIKRIIDAVEIPVMAAGNVRRFEDVKKLLYAGCQKAGLNYAKDSNIKLTEEASKRFGREKLFACIDCADQIESTRQIMNEYVSELVLIEHAGVGTLKECMTATELPLIVPMADAMPDTIAAMLGKEEIDGIYGDVVNHNAKDINAMKSFCSEQGISVNGFDAKISWEELAKNSDGLVPVVVQEYRTKEVLMVAYMNQEALEATVKTGRMTYYSRSRKTQWVKGETSGHYQFVKSLTADCDKDTILAKVSQIGPACHTGSHSCFFREIIARECIDTDPLKVFEDVYDVILDRKAHPKEGSYTNYLFDKGIDKILKKLGEEATEIVIAAKNPDKEEIKYEISDFLYHMMVLMAEKGVSWEEITRELARR
ncbi:MAG: bifunctional phosphoribosyl-AMP cyclohydrolase/phosphoribosyl-ATP diphosphatase HisIE [Lachnospiraceae bacterium]|nr:bifunctional phosphoribosyl-AMP cyclohydrolase/phosphoribosyl-ATP diphosphatase HisIE [Lachnospiraceae bacterium]